MSVPQMRKVVFWFAQLCIAIFLLYATSTSSARPSLSVSVNPSTVYSHPSLSLDITQDNTVREIDSMRFTLPPGFVGAPAAVPQCSDLQASRTRRAIVNIVPQLTSGCLSESPRSQVGTVSMTVKIYGEPIEVRHGRIFNGVPGGNEPGKLLVIVPLPEAVTEDDEGDGSGEVLVLPVKIKLVGNSYRVETEIVGIPEWASSIISMHVELDGDAGGQDEDRDGRAEYFLTTPASCGEKTFDAEFSGYGTNGSWISSDSDSYRATECWPQTPLDFSPDVYFNLSSRLVDSTAGLYSSITQSAGEAPMRATTILLPQGFKTNSKAEGVRPCLNSDVWSCDASSRVGYAHAATPLLDRSLFGTVHLIGNADNGRALDPTKPLKMVALLDGPVRIELQGVLRARRYPSITDGFRIEASFTELPEIPISNFQMSLNGGPNALLKNPSSCGTKEFTVAFAGHHSANSVVTRRPEVEITGCDGPVGSQFSPSLSVPTGEVDAGSHPYFQLQIDRDIDDDPISGMKVSFPPGFVGSPDATARCSRILLGKSVLDGIDRCRRRVPDDPDRQVGIVRLQVRLYRSLDPITIDGSIYNIDPLGDEQARFAILVQLPEVAGSGIMKLEAKVRLRDDYGIDILVDNIPTDFDIYSLMMLIQGFKHTEGRYVLTAPSSCGTKAVRAEFTRERGAPATASAGFNVDPVSCARLPYSPRFDVGLDPASAGSVTDLTTTVWQDHGVGVTGEAASRSIKVSMPQGFTVNSLARDVRRCAPADVEIWACDQSSRIGEATAVSPLTIDPLTGSVHLVETPDGEPMRIAVFLEGIADIRIEGEIKLRPGDMGIDVEFKDLPDLPLARMRLTVEGLLRNSIECGAHSFRANFQGHNGKSATGESTVEVQGCGGIQVAGLAPSLAVSADDYRVGANPRLKITARKRPGDGYWDGIHFKLPKGLAGNPFSVPRCTKGQEVSESCPAASSLGSVRARIQITEFINPLEVNGNIYNAEAVGGDPAGFIVCMDLPPLAGGGKLCTRARVNLRATDYGIDAVIKDSRFGLFDIREIETEFDGKAGSSGGRLFLVNPSICSEQQVRASFSRPLGAAVEAEAPYTATECDKQEFGPKLDVSLGDSSPRAASSIKTTITQSAGSATIEKIGVVFPKGFGINLKSSLGTCTSSQFASHGCPAGSQMGTAVVGSPLLIEPLQGPVYQIRDGSSPTIGVGMDLTGLIGLSVQGKAQVKAGESIQAVFEGLPALPVSTVELQLYGGTRSMLTNPTEEGKYRFESSYLSHSGRQAKSAADVRIGNFGAQGKGMAKLKVRLRPRTVKAYPQADFKVTQPKKKALAIKNLQIKLGKGSRSLRAGTSKLARKGRAARKGVALGRMTVSPGRGYSAKVRVYGKGGRLIVRADRGYARNLSRRIKKWRKQMSRSKPKRLSKRKRKSLAGKIKLVRKAQRLQRRVVKMTKIRLRGNALSVTRLPKSKYRTIFIRLEGRRGRILRNPGRSGKVRFTATLKPYIGKSFSAKDTVEVKKATKRRK